MAIKKRKFYGMWQFWLTRTMQGFRPILTRVAEDLKMTEAELIREAVCSFLAERDAEAAELFRAWKSLNGQR